MFLRPSGSSVELVWARLPERDRRRRPGAAGPVPGGAVRAVDRLQPRRLERGLRLLRRLDRPRRHLRQPGAHRGAGGGGRRPRPGARARRPARRAAGGERLPDGGRRVDPRRRPPGLPALRRPGGGVARLGPRHGRALLPQRRAGGAGRARDAGRHRGLARPSSCPAPSRWCVATAGCQGAAVFAASHQRRQLALLHASGGRELLPTCPTPASTRPSARGERPPPGAGPARRARRSRSGPGCRRPATPPSPTSPWWPAPRPWG